MSVKSWPPQVFARRRSIHVRIGVDGPLALGIGDGEEITVGVVGQGGGTVDSIGLLGNAVVLSWVVREPNGEILPQFLYNRDHQELNQEESDA